MLKKYQGGIPDEKGIVDRTGTATAFADYQVNEALKDSNVTLTLFGRAFGPWARRTPLTW